MHTPKKGKFSATTSTRPPGTTSTLAALSHQTPPASDIQAQPSPPSASYHLCVPSLRTWQRLNPPVSTVEHNNATLTVIAEVAVQDGGQHQTLVQEMVNPPLVRLDADHTVLGKRTRCCTYIIPVESTARVEFYHVPSESSRML